MSIISDLKASLYADFRSGSLLDFAGSNNGAFIGAPMWTGKGLKFDGAADAVDFGSTGLTVKTVAILVDPKTTSEDIADMDGGTHTIEVGSGTITATGFATPSIYVNGLLSSTLVANGRQLITVTSATGFTASAFKVGKETTFLDGVIEAVFTSADALTATEVAQLHGELAAKTWPTKPSTVSNANLKVDPSEPDLFFGANLKPVSGVVVDQGSGVNNASINGPFHKSTVIGDAMSFDGVDDYISIPDTLTTTLSGDFTFSFWIKPADGLPASVGNILGIADNTSGADRLDLRINTDGKMNLNYASNGNLVSDTSTNAVFVDGENPWIHIGITGDASVSGPGGIILWVNGIEDLNLNTSTVVFADFNIVNESLSIGAFQSDGVQYNFYKGAIAGVRVINAARDEAWAAEEYAKGKKALFKTGWGVRESAAIEGGVVGDFLSSTPFRFGDTTFRGKVSADTINGQDVKVLECTTAGDVYVPTSFFQQTPTEAAHGEFELYFNKASASTLDIQLISSSEALASANGYRVALQSDEACDLEEVASGTPTALMTSSATAFTFAAWTKLTMIVTRLGAFTVKLDDVAVTAATGSNPVTDVTYTTSTHVIISAAAGDKISLSDLSGGHSLTKTITI